MSDNVTENDAPEGGEIEEGGDLAIPVDAAADASAIDAADTGDADASDDSDEEGIAIEVEAPDEGVQEEPDPVAVLEERVAALELEKKETFDRLLRATADLDNYRKRARRDVDDAKVAAKGGVLKEVLPVVDNLERALQHSDSSADGGGVEGIVEGVKLVLRQFLQALERCDVTPLESLGQPFDPNLHEAVGQLETDEYEPGAVCQELQRGYKIGDRLLRPALIVMAKAPAEPVGANGHDTSEDAAGAQSEDAAGADDPAADAASDESTDESSEGVDSDDPEPGAE